MSRHRFSLFAVILFFLLLPCLSACDQAETPQSPAAPPQAAGAALESAQSASISSESTEPVSVEKIRIQDYRSESPYSAYLINRKAFFPLEDAASFFHFSCAYDESARTVSIGDPAQAYYDLDLPEITMFPNLSAIVDLPTYYIWSNSEVVDLITLTKGVPYEETLPEIEAALENDGFVTADEAVFAAFLTEHPKFIEGKRENTWFRYTNGSENEPDVAQIIDQGLNQNEIPTIKMRLYPASAVRSRTSEPVEGMEQVKLLLYGEKRSETAYLLEGIPYIAAEDTLPLFGKLSLYREEDHALHVDPVLRGNYFDYLPDISMFPNLSDLFGEKPIELYCHGNVSFWYAGNFVTVMPQISEKLTDCGFAVATEEEFDKLTLDASFFSQGEKENTFIFYPDTASSREGRTEPIGLQFEDSETSEGQAAIMVRLCV